MLRAQLAAGLRAEAKHTQALGAVARAAQTPCPANLVRCLPAENDIGIRTDPRAVGEWLAGRATDAQVGGTSGGGAQGGGD